MPAGHGLRARTRDLFARPFRKKGYIPLTTYLRTYKIGEHVDVKVNGAVHKGMPHKFYHGRTGRVWNVTKRAIGVEINKQLQEWEAIAYSCMVVLGTALSGRGLHVRVEHVQPSRCTEEFRLRKIKNDQLKADAKARGEEWDAIMLSSFALEQQLHTARQELSHALYQHDAACRVIARLKKERDEARALLAQAERQIPASMAGAAPTAVVSNGKRAFEDEVGPDGKKIRPGINPVMIDELTECNTMLSAHRKKRQVPPTLASIDAIERYTQISSHPLHKTNKPGILSMDIHPSKDIIATGGIDTNAVLFDRSSGQILCTLTGHSKKITSLKFVPRDELFVTGSADKSLVRLSDD
ncbi:hypothetical protein OsI_33947 [Oryza sativa Indica Group]|uniref:Pre-mRNA-processing factor 19 n=1 Tax=Oryza sativa subsp. indica TaxID=39946 RepID=B8BHC8_ORYSI|nr:hypothetical protein OsI_33947 [Oryza sativa Indica Group]